MSRWLALVWVGAMGVWAGCGERGTVVHAKPAATPSPETPREPGLVVHPGQLRTSGPAGGTPHSGDIIDIVLSADGGAAFTVDVFRGARLWPDLHAPGGKDSEPIVVPVRDSRRIALGGPAASRILVSIDGAGMARVLRLEPDRSFTELATTPPRPGLLDVDVMPDGKHLILLTAEHVVQLAAVTGEVLATLDERGYRPDQLQLDASGTAALAVAMSPPGEAPNDLTASIGVRRLRIDVSTPALAFEGDEQEIANITAGATLAIAPAVDAIAFLAPVETSPGEQQVIVVDLPLGTRREFGSPIPFEAVRTLGFVEREMLVVARASNGASWLVQPTRSTPLASAPASFAAKEMVAFAPHVRVSALGTTLMIQRIEATGQARHDYLGYKRFVPQQVALSPSGARVAWLNGTDLYIEPVDGRSDVIRFDTELSGVSSMRMLDDDHLAAIDQGGGMHVFDVRTGREISVADTGNPSGLISYDHVTRVMVVSTGAGARVFTIEPDFTLRGPYLIDDGSQIAGVARDPSGAALIWSRDTSYKQRSYTLDELRTGVSRADALQRGVPTDSVNLYYGDVTGRLWGVQSDMTHAVGYQDGAQVVSAELPGRGYVAVPSYSGERVMALVDGTVIEVFSRDGTSLWNRAPGSSLQSYSWSFDGSLLATASPTGGAVWRGSDGEPVLMRCGVEFGRHATAPLNFGASEALMCGAN